MKKLLLFFIFNCLLLSISFAQDCVEGEEVELWGSCYSLDITSLNKSFNDLTGSIPPEIGQLTNLQLLNLSFNDLSGILPEELWNLENLEALNLSNNNLSGEISSNIENLASLEVLQLDNNNFSDEIPDEICNLEIEWDNPNQFNITNIHLAVHDFLHSRFKSKFDVIISNPPYISVDDMECLQKEVKDYDPPSALTDNADGLSFYRRFAKQFDNLLISGGVLMLEFGGNGQKDDIEKIFNGVGLNTVFFKDLQKNWRVVEVYR